MVKDKIIKGNGFILRHIRMLDLQEYFECQQDALTKKGFMSVPNNLSETKKELNEKISDFSKKKPFGECFAIEVEGKFAGYIEIHDLNKKYQEHKCGIGYCVHPKFRGKGLAPSSLKILADYTFKKYKVKRIEAGVRTFNKASIRVLEKAGFKLEGTMKKYYYRNGKYLDSMIWARVK